MDIKVGPITYDMEADADKIRREKSKFPALDEVGFQVVGIKVKMNSISSVAVIFVAVYYFLSQTSFSHISSFLYCIVFKYLYSAPQASFSHISSFMTHTYIEFSSFPHN